MFRVLRKYDLLKMCFFACFLFFAFYQSLTVRALAAQREIERSEEYLYDYDEETGVCYGNGHIQTIGLDRETAAACPSLAKALNDFGSQTLSESRDTFREYCQESKTAAREYDHSYEALLETDVFLRRFDDRVFSFLEFTNLYSGGAHGYYYFSGYNYHTEDGTPVALEEVIKDPDLLGEVIAEKVLERYPELLQIEELTRENLAVYGMSEDKEAYNWVLGPKSILFIFNPYAIAAYASGIQIAEIGFNDYPELFTGAFGEQEGNYICHLSDSLDERFDLDGDGEFESISVSGTFAEYGGYEDLTVRVGSAACTLSGVWYYDDRPYLIHMGDGRNYLFTELAMENDYRCFYLFDLNGRSPEWIDQTDTCFVRRWDEENEVTKTVLPSDPDRMVLDTRQDLLSTYSAHRAYRTDENGRIVPLSQWFETGSGYGPALVTARDLPARKVYADPDRPAGEEILVNAGEKLRIARTNGKDLVDLKRGDGSLVRVAVDTSDWPHRIAGEDEAAWFEQLYYAG